jgi:hypothetical protein
MADALDRAAESTSCNRESKVAEVRPENAEPDWVIRGGVATVEQLVNGASPILNDPGFCEISAAFQPGLTVEELAALSRFPNAQISVTTRDAVLAAGALDVRRTPGRNPVHADIIVPCMPDGTPDRQVVESLVSVFAQRPNPARGPRPAVDGG